jgi:glutathione-regulated potassium-efflux system ancillary protein KefC/glutathione-regulated potassium-efflux system protein KefB
VGFLHEAAVYLAAAVVAVSIFHRLGLGSILGYLVGGALIGPFGLKLAGDVESVQHFSELGIVFFLFVIGLELQPARLWAMRRAVFGLGALQVIVTGLLLAGGGWALGLSPPAALIAGLGLSLSSTAIALQLFGERGQMTAPQGRAAFAILLFQDLAVIPLLALVPLLAGTPGDASTGAGSTSMLLSLAKVVGVLAALVVGSRLVLRPVLRVVAKTKSQELFTATTLLLVMGTALLVSTVGMSMSLGAFVAGVLLADSEYRHELEADIEPFKGLLLGLFFMAVGMSANLGLFAARPVGILGAVLALLVVKITVLLVLARLGKLQGPGARTLALALSQGGEFAFVLFKVAADSKVLEGSAAEFLIVVVSVSMATTPLLFPILERFIEPRFAVPSERAFDEIDLPGGNIVIAGFGRYGQIVARVLRVARIGFTALEKSADQVDFVRRFGNKVYYGDASRLDLLRAAKTESASAFVLAIDDPEDSVRTAAMVRDHFPSVPIFARARNRQHAYKLMDLGITTLNRETYGSSLEMSVEVLQAAGFRRERAKEIVDAFRAHDEETLRRQHAVYADEAQLMQTSRQMSEELRSLFDIDGSGVIGPVRAAASTKSEADGLVTTSEPTSGK